jgi:hypothetical protein
MESKSPFADDLGRVCRSKGHKLPDEKPHPKSSYYSQPRHKREVKCERCGELVTPAV